MLRYDDDVQAGRISTAHPKNFLGSRTPEISARGFDLEYRRTDNYFSVNLRDLLSFAIEARASPEVFQPPTPYCRVYPLAVSIGPRGC